MSDLGPGERTLATAIWLSALLLPGMLTADAVGADRNLLVITVDTIRADHLGCNGSTRVRTPNLDRLADRGANFTRARAPVPLTLPSHASIFTAAYPPTHTVRDNGTFRLPAQQLTLAEMLAERGYNTAAFVGSFVLDRRFGLAQGFDLYDDRTWSDVSMLENLEAERDAGAVFAAFERWLDERREGSPFFAWVHFYDPHAPYEPPEPFRSRYPDDPYAGEIAYTDEIVGRVLTRLKTKGLEPQTIVAVVGDHGEGLGEHGEGTHSLLIYNSTLHVPLILTAPGLIAGGVEVGELVRVIDLAPTLLDYLGLPGELGQGVSLRPLIEQPDTLRAPAPRSELAAYSESLYPELQLGWSRLLGLETERYRFILAPERELYDLAADPGETRNLASSRADVRDRLERRLRELVAGYGEGGETVEPEETLDPATVERLRSLGYLSSNSSARAGRSGGTGADPKRKISLWNDIQRGIFLLGEGEVRAAIEALTAALASDPDLPMVYEVLGFARSRLEEWPQAEETFRRALARGYETAALLTGLGVARLEQGHLQGAEEALIRAIALDSRHLPAHHRLADTYRAQGRDSEALRHYRFALELNPDYFYAWNGLALTLAGRGQDEEALAAFRRVVEIHPAGAEGHFNLAVQLERMRRLEQAAAAYEEFLVRAERQEMAAEKARATAALERLRAKG